MWTDLLNIIADLENIEDWLKNNFSEEFQSALENILGQIQAFLVSSFSNLSSEIQAAIAQGFGSLQSSLNNPSSQNSQAVSELQSEFNEHESAIDSYASEVEVTLSPDQSDNIKSALDDYALGAGALVSSAVGDSQGLSGLFKLPWIDTDFKVMNVPVFEFMILSFIIFSFIGILVHGRP